MFATLGTLVGLCFSHVDLSVQLHISFGAKDLNKREVSDRLRDKSSQTYLGAHLALILSSGTVTLAVARLNRLRYH